MIITRFPPSPTGYFHIGSARTALFNYIFAKQQNGHFLLRFEDTDTKRSRKEYEEDIIQGLDWLGLSYDGAVVRQSERSTIYTTYLTKLLESGKTYEAEASEQGTGHAVRFKNPGTTITFHDLIRGEVRFDTSELGDFVIARSMNDPLYHLTVVVDDMESGVTHVIRGEDHISNTPRQILIGEALSFSQPTYAHLPLILAPDRSKMSKRHGAISVTEYKTEGYLPETVVNYLALLGWHPETEEEIFTLSELLEVFDLKRVQKGGAIFDESKFKWLNKQHIARLTDEVFAQKSLKFGLESLKKLPQYSEGRIARIVPILRERIEIFSDIEKSISRNELNYFFEQPIYDKEALVWKKETAEKTTEHILYIKEKLAALAERSFTKEKVKEALWEYATEHGRGNVLWPLRYALSGTEKSPDPFVLAEIFGKTETLSRIEYALHILS